jgi:hypothetical protein
VVVLRQLIQVSETRVALEPVLAGIDVVLGR